MTFYEVWRRLCAQSGQSESTVCRILGLSPSNPSLWRNGRPPRPSTVKLIADYFGVDVSFFDDPFPEAPVREEEPRRDIGVRVITQEESDLLAKLSLLSERERNAVIRLVEDLCEQSDM